MHIKAPRRYAAALLCSSPASAPRPFQECRRPIVAIARRTNAAFVESQASTLTLLDFRMVASSCEGRHRRHGETASLL